MLEEEGGRRKEEGGREGGEGGEEREGGGSERGGRERERERERESNTMHAKICNSLSYYMYITMTVQCLIHVHACTLIFYNNTHYYWVNTYTVAHPLFLRGCGGVGCLFVLSLTTRSRGFSISFRL